MMILFRKNKHTEIVKELILFNNQLINTNCQQEEFLKVKSLQEIQITMKNHKSNINETMQNLKFQLASIRTRKISKTIFIKMI